MYSLFARVIATTKSHPTRRQLLPDGKDAIMKRRRLTITHALVLSLIVVTSANGQHSSNQRKTLGQRMADLGFGWGQSDAERAPAEQFPDPKADSDSVIPNWLGGTRAKQPQQNSTNSRQPNQATQNQRTTQRRTSPQQQNGRYGAQQNGASSARQQSSQGTNGQRSAATQRSNSGSSFSLPGLGGTPLPSAKPSSPQMRAGSNAGDRYVASPENDPDYPVIRGDAPTQSNSGGTSQNSTAPRKSPTISRDLRHELPDSSSSAGDAPIPRTAQADMRPATSGTMAVDASDALATERDDAAELAPGTEPALAAPVVEAAPESSPGGQQQFAPTQETEPRSAAEAFAAPSSSGRSGFSSEFVRTPRTNAAPAAPSAARSKEAFGEALQMASGGDPTVLVSNQVPVIATDIRGPKQILVGRESVYRVRLQNQGALNAEGIIATIRIPSSAEIVGTSATQGTVRPSAEGTLEWEVSNLEARGNEALDIRLIPRESRPLELGVSWSVAPVGSRAIVEVQEPKLKIEIGGPSEVLFDTPQVYTLTLSNPGTGPAENVRIEIVPPGGTQETATSHDFGTLESGTNRSIEVELTAREAGKLSITAIAMAEGGLTSDAVKEIFCRKPELEVDWRGPATKYAGTPATYFFRVRNPGTAAAEDVSVQVLLPEGAEFSSGSEGQEFDPKTRVVTWRVGTLNPGDDNYMELKCVVNTAGANQFKVTATNAAGNLSDSKVAETTVEAIADLKLSVSDPSGPVAVGTPAIYEITVANRGANTARNVNVVALFSEGIEPDQAEGATYSVVDGRVSFGTIDQIPAGENVKLRIRARALEAGTHVFRAEVLCSDLEIKLAAEETTRFYTDEVLPDAAEAGEQTSSREGFEAAVR